MRDDGSVKTKVVCNIIAINMEGKKEIIGSYMNKKEFMTDLKSIYTADTKKIAKIILLNYS